MMSSCPVILQVTLAAATIKHANRAKRGAAFIVRGLRIETKNEVLWYKERFLLQFLRDGEAMGMNEYGRVEEDRWASRWLIESSPIRE
jgi:hypothetical protein